MKIATLNTWGRRGPAQRISVLREALRSLDADVLCLQEAADHALVSSLGYPTALHPSGSELALLSRVPAIRTRVVTFRTISPLEPYRRQALLAELELGSCTLWVVTTHLAWQAEDGATRLAQMEELLETVAPLGEMVFVSGDMNASPDHPPIHRIRESGFRDLFAELNPKDPGITWDNQNPFIQSHTVRFPDRRIDYLFLHEKALSRIPLDRCEVVCQTPTADGIYPSDHYGVLCDIHL